MEDIQGSASHILDPIDGYRLVQEEDDLRVNYRRIELGAILMAIVTLVQAAGNVVHGIILLWALIGVALSGACIFGWAARRAQRVEAFHIPWLTETFAVFAMLCSSCAGWIAGLERYVTSGYAVVTLSCALFLMVPTRRFVGIVAGTFVFFVIWSLSLHVDFFTKMYSVTNTGFSVLVACFGRAGIERIQHLGRRQRIHIAQQNRKLSDANGALEFRNGQLNDLMAIAAHDLRSPLYRLRNVLELAATAEALSRERLMRTLAAAGQSVDDMLALVTRLLDAHEIEARPTPPRVRTNLNLKAVESAQRLEPLAGRVGIRIDVLPPADEVCVFSDGDSIAQILDNLLSNAIRYSATGSIVEIRLERTPEGASIDIIDRGVGVAEADRPLLFAKFHRGASPLQNGARGSGLGLYIVSVLAGQIGAVCDYRPNPQGGSIFRLSFAAVVPPDPAANGLPVHRPARRMTG